MRMTDPYLAARRVLIAEDELLIAIDLAEAFEKEGAKVIGPVSSVERALSLIENDEPVDFGVLDLRLGGELVYPVADRLLENSIPFMFITGYDAGAIPARFEDVIRLEKPATGEAAVERAEHALLLTSR
jgi:CheY-like chemotaxis protein